MKFHGTYVDKYIIVRLYVGTVYVRTHFRVMQKVHMWIVFKYDMKPKTFTKVLSFPVKKILKLQFFCLLKTHDRCI